MSETAVEGGLGSIPHAYYARETPLTGVVLLPGQARHDPGEHPENVRRLPPVVDRLRAGGRWDELFVAHPRVARTEDLARAHDPGFLEVVEATAPDAPLWLDTDTRVSAGSAALARLASGAALTAVDAVAMEAYHRPDSLFCLTRPPGHHTGVDRAMGFCLYNHVSVAARYAQATYGFERVAILDWDVHHGNGTQEIHWADPSVLFVSLHQWPLYPGTGRPEETGGGEGGGRTINVPLPPGSGDAQYLEALDRVALPAIEAFAPRLLLVSAGQDAHAADPLSNQLISFAGFHAMSARAAALARRLGIGLVLVHEGGYNVSTLPAIDEAIVAGLAGWDPPEGDVFVPPDAAAPPEWPERLRAVLDAQRPFWPDLG